MPYVGVTGYTRLSHDTGSLIFDAVIAALRQFDQPRLHGVTCLARGTDQIFAYAMLSLRGTFEAIIPSKDYRAKVVGPEDAASFDALLCQAADVHCMPFSRSGRPAYISASKEMLKRSDLLIAVWDGRPSRNLGDTAHIVTIARSRRIPVTVLWPVGAICQ